MANADAFGELPAGLELGERYEIIALISAGAMGEVYRAYDHESEAEVALKRLLDRRHAARFEIEARLLSTLSHPRVVEVLDYFRDNRGNYLVMALVEGTDLGDLIEREGSPGLPLDAAVEYALQAGEALRYVHEQHIVHRDVKPQNLILGEDGVVLVDFGIARELAEEDTGTVGIGTPRFMAPEVFAGGMVSPRSDVFGLAATLWTLIVGKPPVYADPTPLRERVPGVPPELEKAIQAGLELIPERRIASVAAFAKALGTPLPIRGESLALSVAAPDAPGRLLEGIVRTAAGVFGASASSIALTDAVTGELVFQSAWGAGAREIVGVRLAPGTGIAGSVVQTGEAEAVQDCRTDERFANRVAAGTGYVPHTMLVVPLKHGESTIGALSFLDRRDGLPYGPDEMLRAELFGELVVTALEVQPDVFTSLGSTRAV